MRGKRAAGLLLLLLFTLSFILVGIKWLHYRLTHAITDAVFVESETFTKVAYKRVSGRIEKLFKEEGDKVKKGEPLAKIDDRDYVVRLQELESTIDQVRREREALQVKAKALREELRRSMELVSLEAKAVQKQIDSLVVKKELLERDRERFEKLYAKGVVPSRTFEDVDTNLRSLDKEIAALEAKKVATLSQRKVLEAKLKQTQELDRKIEALSRQIEALLKRKEDLENMIGETLLRSPIDGYVVKRFVSEGDVVREGQYVYAVYDPKDLYLLVLLEETKLEGVKEGNRVSITIDAFPDIKFEGVVKEINRATAAKFAVIPRDITAGEFTKVAQRIPVKVEITRGQKNLLRVGMGGEVAIEKHSDR